MVLSVVNEKDRFNEQSKAPKRKPTKDYVRIYKQIMQNKANFENAKMYINLVVTSYYKGFSNRCHEKTKPIQSQFKPNLTQNKPNTKPIKPKTNPIKAKRNAFAWVWNLR